MKRKLDENDSPSVVPETGHKEKKAGGEDELSFTQLGLDPRLLQAVAKLKFEKPTLVQRKAIPLAISGQDVLCKAKTGSGKTAAYVLPILASTLKRRQVRTQSTKNPAVSLTVYIELTRCHNFYPDSCTDARTRRSSIQGN